MSTPTADSPAIIDAGLIDLDADLGSESADVIGALAGRLAAEGRATDATALRDAALAREAQSATGLPGGIAIPHCRSAAVTTASLGFARLQPKVDFGAPDGPADLVFLIAAPEGAGAEHMKLLSGLARSLVKPDFVAALRAAPDADAVVVLVHEALGLEVPGGPATETPAPPAPAAPEQAEASGRYIVAVTACPTGIAHTYMAADARSPAATRESAAM